MKGLIKSIIRPPHVSTYKRRWVRRTMIVLTFPIESVWAIYELGRAAAWWWRQPSESDVRPIHGEDTV